ncbi:MAG: hypothetical protein L0Y71_15770 [Gemmataceae bacterium]|nr:hypothetical protein [Gemmataceae bacterium]
MDARCWLPLLIVALVPAGAAAHGIDLEWKQIGERVTVEAFFDDDTPARDARVQILDAQKAVVASGKTDAQGKCSLPTPKPGKYQIVVDAGAGHRKQRPFTIGTPSPTLPVPTAPADPPSSSVTSGGANRQEVTRFPWERAAIGCGVIAALLGAWRLTRRGPG